MLPEQSAFGSHRASRQMEKSIYYQQQPLDSVKEEEREKVSPRRKKQQHVRTEGDFFGLFDCCQNVPVEHQHETMVRMDEIPEPQSRSRYVPPSQPYMSLIRMKNRQNKPNNIYNDHLVAEKLTQSRWTYLDRV